ncbi:hypothetical protein SUGI_0896360 [Cryptomeria japonica]|nr:hypothetical protein SUGI_0896360 [Cryptomeria japonica]
MLGFGMGRNTFGNENVNSPYDRSNNNGIGKSPIPYLFGGVAAMLALIAVALLILACSFWKLSGHSGEANDDGSVEKKTEVWKEEDSEKKVVVIMAGDAEPTFLAKPAMHDVV